MKKIVLLFVCMGLSAHLNGMKSVFECDLPIKKEEKKKVSKLWAGETLDLKDSSSQMKLLRIIRENEASKIAKITIGKDAGRLPVNKSMKLFKNLRVLEFEYSKYISKEILESIPNWVTELKFRLCSKRMGRGHVYLENDDLKPLKKIEKLKILTLKNLYNIDDDVFEYIPKNVEVLKLSGTAINIDVLLGDNKILPKLKRLEILSCEVKMDSILKLLCGEKEIDFIYCGRKISPRDRNKALNMLNEFNYTCLKENFTLKTKNLEVIIWLDGPWRNYVEGCPICLKEICGIVPTISCGHKFHNRCITKWANQIGEKKLCPICRRDSLGYFIF